MNLNGQYTLFLVKLQRDGGENGSEGEPASYTYVVLTLEGVELGTGASPEWARPAGSVEPATLGTAYFAGDALHLYQTDEVPDVATDPLPEDDA